MQGRFYWMHTNQARGCITNLLLLPSIRCLQSFFFDILVKLSSNLSTHADVLFFSVESKKGQARGLKGICTAWQRYYHITDIILKKHHHYFHFCCGHAYQQDGFKITKHLHSHHHHYSTYQCHVWGMKVILKGAPWRLCLKLRLLKNTNIVNSDLDDGKIVVLKPH